MTRDQKIALGLIVVGGGLLLLSRSGTAAPAPGAPSGDKTPPTTPPRRTTPGATQDVPVLQAASDISAVTNDAIVLQRVTERMRMQLDALAVAPSSATVNRALRYLASKGTYVPDNLDLVSDGPVTIWTARKINEEIWTRFYA